MNDPPTPAEAYLARQIRENPIFQAFVAFIDRAGDRRDPRLGDIDLMSEYGLARNIYIFDIVEDTPEFLIRYVGSAICDFFGFDPTRRHLENLDFVESFDETIAGYRAVVRDRRPYVFLNHIAFQEERISAYRRGRHFVMLRLAFPLFDGEGRVDHIIGAMDFLDPEDSPGERFVGMPYAGTAADG